MNRIADQSRLAASLEHATVQAVTEGGLIVHGQRGVTTARAAVGCLIEPTTGDRVLISRSGDECFVLTVLAREHAERRIRVEGPLTVEARNLSLVGSHEAVLESGRRLQLRAEQIGVDSGEAEIHGRRLSASGDRGHAHFREMRLLSSTLEVITDRLVQCARQVARRVEEVETLHVGNLIQRVRENLVSRSKRTSITASGDVHVDGERIHMG